MKKITLKNGKITIVFYIFLIFSVLFLFSGVYSAYTFANIIYQKDQILSTNPAEVIFNYTLTNNSYFLTLTVHVKNTGPMNFWVTQISWLTFLINNTEKYQANDYSILYGKGILIQPGEERTIKVTDNDSVKQWDSYVYPHLLWQKKNFGKTTWEVQLSVEGHIDNYQVEEYRFNIRTWYLWKLPEVVIEHDEVFNIN